MENKDKSKSEGMVDISDKEVTKRRAVATGKITFRDDSFETFLNEGSYKGDILETAKVAAIMAAKNTPNIIPLCHPLLLEKVNVSFEIDEDNLAVIVQVEVICNGKTGVEMEALCACTTACLTIYDMMKWSDKHLVISDIKLNHKSGGKSGILAWSN